ncbi:MAG TPA: hypothetical protein VFZ72_12165 [Jiangellaceae bacterium]
MRRRVGHRLGGPDGRIPALQISDDGVGGAHLGKGHGIAGLADRLAGIDCTLEVHSPVGGGTVISAQMPAV